MQPCREFRRRKVETHPSRPLEGSRRDGLRRPTRLLQPMLNCKNTSPSLTNGARVAPRTELTRSEKQSHLCQRLQVEMANRNTTRITKDCLLETIPRKITTRLARRQQNCLHQWPMRPISKDPSKRNTCQCFTSFFVQSLFTVCTPFNEALHTFDSVTFASQQLTPNKVHREKGHPGVKLPMWDHVAEIDSDKS